MAIDKEATKFFKLQDATPLIPGDDIELRTAYGSAASLSLVRLGPGAELPLHEHPHEQLGFVLSGIQILLVDGAEHHVHAHEAYAIPGGVTHGGRGGPDGCVALDIFIPTREEYRAAAAPELQSLTVNAPAQ